MLAWALQGAPNKGDTRVGAAPRDDLLVQFHSNSTINNLTAPSAASFLLLGLPQDILPPACRAADSCRQR